ncbi:unnamed protein product [Clavelina lepadiformis]|uniref:Deacetylase sirtuin-type domain-containing protein n=1 Tax=Clavelina lepadiformis TaxID=159417 RepID=A0ABP0GQC6_CLALP
MPQAVKSIFRFCLGANYVGLRDLTFTKSFSQAGLVYHPKSSPVDVRDVEKLNKFLLESKNLLILSGAGLSTESGIPDYRSKDVGLYDRVNHKPMKHQEFMSSEQSRQRYWARNYVGWKHFVTRSPNLAHKKLFELEKKGKSHWHVTQNVDGLNAKAGIENLTELHGSMYRVVCLNCEHISPREVLQKRFNQLNKNWTTTIDGYGPDADVFLNDEDAKRFIVPPCKNCGGVLKPSVTFFGDTVPIKTVHHVYDQIDKSDAVLVVGSSLQVWSGYRFILRAKNRSIPISAINVGPTRADDLFDIKIDALCTEILNQVEI